MNLDQGFFLAHVQQYQLLLCSSESLAAVFRITGTSGKCGKPNCHCSKRDDPGHGPNFRLTRRVKGKTVTETFPSPAALRKSKQEVAEFHRFQTLCGEIVEISEKICALWPVADTLTPEKKTAEAIHAEIAREVTTLLGRIFAEQKQTGGLDLEAVEMGFRAALHQAGAAALSLSELLQFETPPPDRRQLRCGCGHRAQCGWVYHRQFQNSLRSPWGFITSAPVLIFLIGTPAFLACVIWYRRKKRAELVHLQRLESGRSIDSVSNDRTSSSSAAAPQSLHGKFPYSRFGREKGFRRSL
ncbi:MAG TPA: DUF6788 family protein [Bryobacteraceae bacterium]|nr:DUF6788 family protein [Bryobacteraceae bacterium]